MDCDQRSFVEWFRGYQMVTNSFRSILQAPTIHEARVKLDENDNHLIKEIIQRADENTYGEDVLPSLELFLAKADVAGVGASATLLVLNNDNGLDTLDFMALCTVSDTSTKAGTWLNSLFSVCESPIIISKGFRIKFHGDACTETGWRQIIPEWTELPMDDTILSICGRLEKPTTVIILPVLHGKAGLVRRQLKNIRAEFMLFSLALRGFRVVDLTKDALDSGDILRVTRSEPISIIKSEVCKFFKLTLEIGCSAAEILGKNSYLIFQRLFPVTHSVQERQKVHDWTITLAFPQENGAPTDYTGYIYSLFPTELRTGFPFIVSADFILTSSRETIKSDSPWNVGILNSIPTAFRIAFEIMLQKPASKPLQEDGISETWQDESQDRFAFRDPYQFLPGIEVEEAYRCSDSGSLDQKYRMQEKLFVEHHWRINRRNLEKVRREILYRLRADALILGSCRDISFKSSKLNSLGLAFSGLQVKPSFHKNLHPLCLLGKNIDINSYAPDSMVDFVSKSLHPMELPAYRVLTKEFLLSLCPMTIEYSIWLVRYLKVSLKNRLNTTTEHEEKLLFMHLKTFAWMKTLHHGWQCPPAVFFPTSESHFPAGDLPCLDLSAYDPFINLTDPLTRFILDQLEVVTDVKNGCAAVAEYFSNLPAEKLDLETVHRFYSYLHESGWRDTTHRIEIWIPFTGTSKDPVWRAPTGCVIKDEENIFSDSSVVTVLEKLYDTSLVPFFCEVLHVPEKASIDFYCKVWLKWCNYATTGQQASCHMKEPLHVREARVRSVWKNIIQNRHKCSEEVWLLFLSQAQVPVDPTSLRSVNKFINETIRIVPPSQAFIPDNPALSKSFSEILRGKVNFTWLLPDPLDQQSLLVLYSTMGVRKLSEAVECHVNIPPNVVKIKISEGEGLLCEGLFRTLSAYLCQRSENYGLSFTVRQRILSPLLSATEVVISQPFEKCFSLKIDPLSPIATLRKDAFSHYDEARRTIYSLRRDHAILQEDLGKKIFNTQFAATVSIGILSEHPELVPGFFTLLEDLCDSGFAMKSVENELRRQNLVIFPEDEKLLMENMAVRR